MPSESPPSPTKSVPLPQGLSSPFHGVSGNFLSSPYHVIDISPSPPPPTLLNSIGQFDDAPSPELPVNIGHAIDSTTAASKGLSSDFQSRPTFKLSSSSAPMIGLGLGIDIGEGSLASFIASGASALNSRLGRGGKPVSSFGSQGHPSRQKKRLLAFSRSTRSRRSLLEDKGYLGEDEDDEDQDDGTFDQRPTDIARKPDNNTQDSILDTKPYQLTSREALQRKKLGALEAHEAPLLSKSKSSTKGPKRLSFKKMEGSSIDSTLSSPVNPWQVYHSHQLGLKDVVEKAMSRPDIQGLAEPTSKLFRRFIASRGNDDSAPPDSVLPIYPSDLSPNITSSTAPSLTSIASLATPTSFVPSISCTSTMTGTLSSMPNIAATSIPSLAAQDSPLFLPSSPRLGIHSPNMGSAPGSFSPSAMDASVFPDSILNTPGPNDGGMNPNTGTLVFSILAGSLGLVGIFGLLFTILLKKHRGWSGLLRWKRMPRGTAYDEFIEEEKRWWIRETKMAKEQSRQSIISEEISKEDLGNGLMTAGAQAVSIARSISGAPLIPPIPNIVGGKISIDSIRIELHTSSSVSDCLSISSESSGDLSDPSHHDTTYGNMEKAMDDMRIIQYSTSEVLHRIEPPAPAGRARSESKSSILSKASKKSMSSITSFFRLGLLNAVDSKFKLGAGVSSKDFSHVVERNQPKTLELTHQIRGPAGIPSQPSSTISTAIKSPVLRNILSISTEFDPDSVEVKSSLETTSRPSTAPTGEGRTTAAVSWTPPEILITDHPSELVPPSPPPTPPPGPRPISIGTTFTRFSTTSYLSQSAIPQRDTPHEPFSVRLSSPPPIRGGAMNPVLRYESSIIDPEMIASLRDTDEPVRGSCSSIADERGTSNVPLPSRPSRPGGPGRITSLSSLLSSRAQTGASTQAVNFQSKIQATSRFVSSQRSSSSSIGSSKTIRELAAVTEDLRALIDLDTDGDYSWHSPTQFHKSVPDRVPGSSSKRPPPPTRPPKSVNRYNRGKKMSIEYESTSTPSSPINPHMHFPHSSISSETSYTSDWSLDLIQPPSRLYNRHGRPAGIMEVSTTSNVKHSNSGSSLGTIVSGESNTSLFEVASLHTAQTIKGASVEFVVRSPPQVASSRRSGPMMAIVEEMEE
ncbi:hypothetical protein CROQUDRAFT_674960 [Cronartium quercuum f. sp. fusiforme G11]|uniref:Uncharacterized protein n=1 Tax=Cronartium quercuum f. sp. fusiforme G11 TaxID=708437 RepID=A0A9P6N6J5_9BASI|nr:hypothetical protein CROQUDRAFT_674960 [Cronartium quercuum f. sp. fusiforme G11]